MIDDIEKIYKNIKTLKCANNISKNGCSNDDYIYSSFLLGQQNILDIIIEELRVFLEIYGDKDE